MPPQPRRRFGSLAGVLLLVLAVLCLGLVQPTQGVWLGLRARQQLQHQQQQSDWLGSLANAARTVANKAISGAARSQTSAGTSAARKEYLADTSLRQIKEKTERHGMLERYTPHLNPQQRSEWIGNRLDLSPPTYGESADAYDGYDQDDNEPEFLRPRPANQRIAISNRLPAGGEVVQPNPANSQALRGTATRSLSQPYSNPLLTRAQTQTPAGPLPKLVFPRPPHSETPTTQSSE